MNSGNINDRVDNKSKVGDERESAIGMGDCERKCNYNLTKLWAETLKAVIFKYENKHGHLRMQIPKIIPLRQIVCIQRIV